MAFPLIAITVLGIVMLIPEAGDLGVVVVWVVLSTAMLLFIAMIGNRKDGTSAFPLTLHQPSSADITGPDTGARNAGPTSPQWP
jgi:multisubunit Na+/H+ antiporter MnhC subunit